MLSKSFIIDCFIERKLKVPKEYVPVAVDVIRSSTVAINAVNSGRKCFFAPSVDSAIILSKNFKNALLVGEVGGNMPYGFDLNNSPVEVEKRAELERPAILVSTSGTPLYDELRKNKQAFIACFRNCFATAKYLNEHHRRIFIIGAPTRGEFREEDQLCCAWIAAELMKVDYFPEDKKTVDILNRWKNASVDLITDGKSAEYLRRSGQTADLEYILSHVNDLNSVFAIREQEIVRIL
jgi:2-phosphosulfolactate phosphatase